MGGIYSAFVTSLRECIPPWRTLRKPSPPSASTHLPCDILLYMSKFLKFENYRNLIEAYYPGGGEDELIRQRLWKLSTRTHSTGFFNGKELQVELNDDDKRSREDRILLNMNTLLPITGPIYPIDTDFQSWMSPRKLINIVLALYVMDKCSEYRYADCDCCRPLNKIIGYPETFAELRGTQCPYGHYITTIA